MFRCQSAGLRGESACSRRILCNIVIYANIWRVQGHGEDCDSYAGKKRAKEKVTCLWYKAGDLLFCRL